MAEPRTKAKIQKSFIYFISIVGLLFLTACGSGSQDKKASDTSSSSLNTSLSASTLTVTPAALTVNANTVTQLQVSGGKAPYNFVIAQGSLDATVTLTSGIFTAPSTTQVVNVLVSDNSSPKLSTMAVISVIAANNNSNQGSNDTPSSDNQCFATAATGTGAVHLFCDANQTLAPSMLASCADGSLPVQAKLGDLGTVATCLNNKSVGVSVSCCRKTPLTSGTAYRRIVWANTVGPAAAYCAQNESASQLLAICGLSLKTAIAVNSSDGRPGLSLACGSNTFASLGVYCSGTAQ